MHALEPGVAGPPNHVLEVGGKRLVGQMAVGIDHRTVAVRVRMRRERGLEIGGQARLRRGVGEAVLDRVARHALQRPVVQPLLFDGLAILQRQRRPRHPRIVGHQRHRHAVFQVAAQRMAAALDAEDQVAAAQRDLDQHLLRRQSRAAAPSGSSSYMTPAPWPMRDAWPVRTDSRMWKRSVSGGTSPSTSSPACSVILTAGYCAVQIVEHRHVQREVADRDRIVLGLHQVHADDARLGGRDLEARQHLREDHLRRRRARHLEM